MGRIPQQVIEEVLGRTNVLDIVQQYVALKKAGVNYKGLCPFHQENSPSFFVHPGKGIFKCFGCGAGGDAITFIQDLEGWSFHETVRHLATRVGVEVPEETPEEAEKARAKQEARRLYQSIMSATQDFYESNLWGLKGQQARSYLVDRGVDEGTARKFGLGYAPKGWQNLLDYLKNKEIKAPLVERAGLALHKQDNNSHYDRFRDRLLFPVVDIWGNTLAFSGRVLPGDDGPKYINSSETKFYTKGEQLYGLHVAKKGIQQQEYALLVEGNFDVVTLHAMGFDMTIAPMGTAFTNKQARLLKRYTSRVVIAFDGDDAGAQATLKCLVALEDAGLEGRVVRFEKGDDPDSFVRREGAEALRQKIEQARPLLDWALDGVLPAGDFASPIEDRLQSLKDAAEILQDVRNPILLAHYKQELERRLVIDPALFQKYFKPKAKTPQPSEPHQQAQTRPPQKMDLDNREFVLLVLLLEHPQWLVYFCQESLPNLLQHQEMADFLELAADYHEQNGRLDAPILLKRCEDEHFKPWITKAFASIGEFYEEDKAVDLYQDTVRAIKAAWAERSIQELERQRQSLDLFKDREAYMALEQERKQLLQFREMQRNTAVPSYGT